MRRTISRNGSINPRYTQEATARREAKRLRQEFRDQIIIWTRLQIAAEYTEQRVEDLLRRAEANKYANLAAPYTLAEYRGYSSYAEVLADRLKW